MGLCATSKLLWLLLLAYLSGPDPEATVTDFVAAWNAGDVSKAATMVVGGKPTADFSAFKNATPKGMAITLSNMTTSLEGDKAQVTVLVELRAPDQQTMTQTETVSLVRVNGNWLIVPASPTASSQHILPALAMVTTDSEVFARAKEAAKKTACLSNIKQLGVASIMYVTDYDDVFKMNASKMKAALNPYTKSDRMWFCPSHSKTVAAYSINTNLIGKNINQIKDPAKTVMLYEGSKGKLVFRHAGSAAVCFADGHAKMIKAADAQKLIWKP